MKAPGFTAEASLYETSEHYGHRSQTGAALGRAVLLQLGKGPFGRCIPGCVCVTSEGCPCCTSIDDWLKGWY